MNIQLEFAHVLNSVIVPFPAELRVDQQFLPGVFPVKLVCPIGIVGSSNYDGASGKVYGVRSGVALILARCADQQALERSLPAQVAAVLQAGDATESEAVTPEQIRVSAVRAYVVVAAICGVREPAVFRTQADVAKNIASVVCQRGVTQVDGIDALRQQRIRMQEVEVLRVVVEAENSLHAASADAQPGLKFVLSVSPIELGIPISQSAQIAVVELSADAESVCDLGRCVHAEI